MRRLRQTAWVTLSAVALWGCSMAPVYEQPASPVPDRFSDQPQLRFDAQTGQMQSEMVPAAALAQGKSGDSSAAEIDWRDFFRDPALLRLIELALQGNRDLQIAVARMDQAQALWGVQRGEMFPALGAVGAMARQRGAIPGSANNVITSQYSAGIAVTAFELDLFGRLRNLSEAAFQQYLASAEGAQAVQISLVADTAVQYFRWRLAQNLVALTEQTLSSRQRSDELVRARFANGVASEIDVVQARGLVDAAAASLAAFVRDEQTARNALAVLIGQPVPDNLPSPASFEVDRLLANIPVGLPAELLVRRPDIRAAENQLLAANANIGAARAAFFPNISLTGSLGTASSSLDGLFGSGSSAWSFTPSVTIPIFAGGSLRANLAQTQARQREAVANYEREIQQAFREVDDALSAEATLQAQLQARRSQAQAAQRFFDLGNARFTSGVDSFLEVQIAQVQLFDARVSETLIAFEVIANRINLYKALGGGWDDAAVQSRYEQPVFGSRQTP